MKIIRHTDYKYAKGLLTSGWFTETKQDVIEEIGRENYNKLLIDGIYQSKYATFKVIYNEK